MELERTREKIPIRPKEPAPKPAEKPAASPFDKVLERSRQLQQSPTAPLQQAGQGREEEQRAERRAERQERRREWRPRREREKETGHRTATREEEQAAGPRHRVVTKVALKREQGGGMGGGAEQHGGGQGSERKEAATKRLVAETKIAATHQAERLFREQVRSGSAPPARLTSQQLQRLVNQMVQYIRVGRTTVGADELQIGFHASVFHGLRLRLSSQHGKVTVQFEASHADVIRLFTNEKARIAAALGAKGIRLAAVHVVHVAGR
ncbi:MAG: hypothetical protein HY543_09350 [Deltaproteobacteria bacterium]|nr:hypothetical protein [Deltaproteobacteria bacterium]